MALNFTNNEVDIILLGAALGILFGFIRHIKRSSARNLNQKTDTLDKGQEGCTDEYGNTYKRVSEYELKGLYHRGTDAMGFVGSLKNATSEELDDVPLYLLREPKNAYDQWAIKVINSEGLHIGYVQREASEQISNNIDDGKYLEARFTIIIGDYIKMRIFHRHIIDDGEASDSSEDKLTELMNYDRVAELEQQYLSNQLAKAELKQQRIREEQTKAHRAERMRKQEYIGYELEAENKIDEAIIALSKLVDKNIESHSAHRRLCIMLRKTKSYEDELWAAEKWLELLNRQRQNNIDVTTKIIEVKRRIAKINILLDSHLT